MKEIIANAVKSLNARLEKENKQRLEKEEEERQLLKYREELKRKIEERKDMCDAILQCNDLGDFISFLTDDKNDEIIKAASIEHKKYVKEFLNALGTIHFISKNTEASVKELGGEDKMWDMLEDMVEKNRAFAKDFHHTMLDLQDMSDKKYDSSQTEGFFKELINELNKKKQSLENDYGFLLNEDPELLRILDVFSQANTVEPIQYKNGKEAAEVFNNVVQYMKNSGPIVQFGDKRNYGRINSLMDLDTIYGALKDIDKVVDGFAKKNADNVSDEDINTLRNHFVMLSKMLTNIIKIHAKLESGLLGSLASSIKDTYRLMQTFNNMIYGINLQKVFFKDSDFKAFQ